MFDDFYKDRIVLVTGLAGAKGAWVGWYLLEAGAGLVIGIDNAESLAGTCFEASGLADEERVTLLRQDVRDLSALQAVIRRGRISAVIHLAAMAIVGECKESPLAAYSNNVLGAASLLEAVRTTDVERAAIITTDKVYQDKGGEPWVEDDPLGATGPYAVSKACADMIAQDYFGAYLLPAGKCAAIGRAGNVLVPGDHHDGRIFVDVARALAKDEPPIILNPAFTRPYTFVGDVVAGYLSLLAQCDRREVNGEAFNFGPREVRGVPNGDLATGMCELWGSGVTWQRGRKRDEPFQHQSLDWSKAERVLGWRPTYDLDEGLGELVAWYKAQTTHPAPGELREVTLETVRRHVAAAGEQEGSWAT